MADFGAAASGAVSGATTGFALGGTWGAAAGGLVGAAGGLFGAGRKKKKRSTFDKKQKQINDQQQQGILGQGPLADLYNYNPDEANKVFDQISARPAQRNFAENTVPTITGAFRNQGLQNSSYVGDALSKAGRDVQEKLDALRTQALYNEKGNANTSKRNAIENIQNRQNFAYDTGAKQGGFDINSILSSVTPAAADKLKGYFGKYSTPTAATPPIR